MKGLTHIPGVRVGHVSDFEAVTGCTVILTETGAIAGVDVGGSATGSQELDLLSPLHTTPHIHGICLSGGSAFGLEAASGVRNYLEEKGVGYVTASARVPLVPGAILYDLAIGKSSVRPTREMGYAAAKIASDEAVVEGSVGVGTGATVGKFRGMQCAMKGGVGSFTIRLGRSVIVPALVAVNPFGDVLDKDGKVLAGARRSPESRDFLNAAEAIRSGARMEAASGNTILAVVATNARLTKPQTSRLAALAQHGMIRRVSPVHTIYDGDIVFGLSIGSEAADFVTLGVAAADALSESIMRAVRSAKTLGGVPSLS